MKIIKLKKEETDFIELECKSDVLRSYLSKGFFDEKSSAIVLMLHLSDIEIFADELVSILMERGVDESGEINSFGKRVDDLIDKFNYYE